MVMVSVCGKTELEIHLPAIPRKLLAGRSSIVLKSAFSRKALELLYQLTIDGKAARFSAKRRGD